MDFATRISVTCFAASYAIAMVCEVLRAFWPTRTARWLATVAALAGIFAQTLFLIAIAVRDRHLPIATQFESLITVSWLISLVYLYLLVRDRRLAAGIFILPISLGLVLFAATLSERGHGAAEDANRVIAMAHGMLFLLGTVMVVVAFVVAMMYLVKVRQLKSGTLLGAVRLPSLERLDYVNTVAVYIAWPLLTIGTLLGFSLRQLQWTDPKVVTTAIAWFLFTVLAHYRYRPENRGRKVALLTLFACAAVLVSVLGDPLFGTSHQSATDSASRPAAKEDV